MNSIISIIGGPVFGLKLKLGFNIERIYEIC